MVRLDRADASLLRRTSDAVPEALHHKLETRLITAAEEPIATALPSNKHARDKRLRTIIRQELTHFTELNRIIDWAFREQDRDDFTRPQVLRELVLRHLSTRAATEVRQLSAADPDAEPKRRLKVLTSIATPGGSQDSRAALLRALTTGSTAAFPYILKYIAPGALPVIRSFEKTAAPTLAGLTPPLIAKFPGADLVHECLRRYIGREGVLTHFMDPDAPITGKLARAFDALDEFVPRHAGGLFVPKGLALSENRRDRFRMPDGIACGLGLATLTECLLRQAVVAKNWGGPKNARGGELVARVQAQIALSPETVANLEVIFDQRSLSLRDAMAHAAFFADDEARVEAVVGGLSQTLALLVNDLAVANVLGDALAAPRWDAGGALDAAQLALIDEQYGPGYNIVDQIRDDEARDHVFKVLSVATPDKRLLGSAAFLLWISGQRDEHAGEPFDDAQQFAALFGSLLTLEELVRALYEANSQRVLRVTPGGDVVRCHLAMLDDQPGELLERRALEALFRHFGIEEKFVSSFLAVRAVRDLAFHGCWEALPKPWARYTHLVVKLIFTLCSIAHFKPLRGRPTR
jgi:hypothetical protein